MMTDVPSIRPLLDDLVRSYLSVVFESSYGRPELLDAMMKIYHERWLAPDEFVRADGSRLMVPTTLTMLPAVPAPPWGVHNDEDEA